MSLTKSDASLASARLAEAGECIRAGVRPGLQNQGDATNSPRVAGSSRHRTNGQTATCAAIQGARNPGRSEANGGPDVAGGVARDFWSRVDVGADDRCWLWTGPVAGKGYGYHRKRRAHRVAFEMVRGPIPDGLVLDHLCRERLCCNPAHLQPVTNRTNVLRGDHPNAVAHRRNRCRRGHSLRDARVTAKGRECRTCHNLRERERKRAIRAGGVA